MVNNNVMHFFSVDDAKKFGINEAIVLQNIRHWVYENKARGHNFFDGKYWTYNSVTAFAEIFYYMSEKQIRGALDTLETLGEIVSGNYNKHGFDKTKWYTLSENQLGNQHYDSFALQGKRSAPEGKRSALQGKPIPYINNNINNKENTIVENSTNLSTTPIEEVSKLKPNQFENELVEIYNYLSLKSGIKFKHTSSHSTHALNRLKEGKTIAEFKKVIDSKCAEWLSDPEMRKFLRPSTLFCKKHFDEYSELSEIPPSSNPSSTQTLAVDTEARAKADAILAEQNYHRDKISNYQIENNLFQSAKTGTVYEAIFINPNQQEVLLLALDSKEVISLSAEELKLLRYKKKVEMITKSAMQTLLTKHPDFNYHETHKEFLSQKV